MQAQAAIADGVDIEQLYEYMLALRQGNFSFQLNVPEMGRAREVVMNLNRHIQDMGALVSEFTRVCNEVGIEGRLGPQADAVLNGPYRKTQDALNVVAGNVTDHVRDIQWTLDAFNKEGRVRKVHENCDGEWKQMKASLNELIERASAKPAPVSQLLTVAQRLSP